MINLPALARQLDELGIMSKSFVDLSRDEALAMVKAVVESLVERRMPYVALDRHGNHTLIVPADAPPELQPWLHEDSYAAGFRLLRFVGADEAMMEAHLGPDWRVKEASGRFAPGWVPMNAMNTKGAAK